MVCCKKAETIEPPILITLAVSNVTSVSGQSGGNITSAGGGQITDRGVVWSQMPGPTLEQNNGMTHEGSGIGLFHSNIAGLKPNTSYFVRAFAVNKAGVAYGNEQQFNTKGTVPEVTTLAVINVTPYSAKAGGIVSDDYGSTVIVRGIIWSTLENPTIENYAGKTSDGIGTGEFESIISGLDPKTTYYVRAYASNSFGAGYGQQETFESDGITPGEGVTDIDGNFYPSVIIGNQEWMAENLKTTRYRNGTPINFPGVDNTAWLNNSNGAYAWYNNDLSWKDLYGGLYNWHAVNNSNGLCPTGWHVPSDSEWTELVNYLVALGFPDEWDNPNGVGNALKSCRQVSSPLGGDCNTSEHPRWNSYSTHAYGIDIFGFSALPGGFRFDNGTFSFIGFLGGWWSSTQISPPYSHYARYRGITYDNTFVDSYEYAKEFGFSVRCIRNNAP